MLATQKLLLKSAVSKARQAPPCLAVWQRRALSAAPASLRIATLLRPLVSPQLKPIPTSRPYRLQQPSLSKLVWTPFRPPPTPVSFTLRAAGTRRSFHASRRVDSPPVIIFHGARAIMTAVPILWRFDFFKKYPKTMWTIVSLPVVGVVALIVWAYEEHPFTQRARFMFIDEPTELEMADAAHAELISEFGRRLLLESDPCYVVCEDVVSDLIKIVGPVRDWQLYVIDAEDNVNAFVLSSGKIFVYTGLLGAVTSKDELAAILSHEFAHVLSRHHAEKRGFEYLSTLVIDLIHSFLYTMSLNLPLISDLLGRGVDTSKDYLTVKPYSRMCEAEADVIGLYLMSMAGYDPKAAVDLWASWAKNEEDAVAEDSKLNNHEFFSTHPSHARRSEDLRVHLPAATEIFKACHDIATEFDNVRLESLKTTGVAEELVVEEGVGKKKWHSIEELDRALFQILEKHIGESVFWFARKEARQSLVDESLKLMEVGKGRRAVVVP